MLFSLASSLLLTWAFVALAFENLSAFSEDLPSIICPDKFEYISYGTYYAGKITIYGAIIPTLKVEALFSQQKPIIKSYNNSLALIESATTIEANLLNGKPITYRVEFPDPQLLPKLMRLRVNDRTICSDNRLTAFSSIFATQHIFYPSLETLSRSSQSNRLKNPFKHNTVNSLAPVAATATTTNFESICGQETSNFSSSDHGDNDFERGQFPWLTAIYTFYLPALSYKCVGSLISTRTVITAARCFLDPSLSADQIVVFLGCHNLSSPEVGIELRNVQTLIKHPEFNTSVWADANIALLHMRTPVSFTQFIRPICLWSSSAALSKQIGFNAKWILKRTGQRKLGTLVPKVFEVDIVSDAECLRGNSLFHFWSTSRTLCAGKRDGNVPCSSGVGSGLMIKYAGKWILRAIFTSGVPIKVNGRFNCDPNDYAIYSDLSKHVTWVRRNMLQ